YKPKISHSNRVPNFEDAIASIINSVGAPGLRPFSSGVGRISNWGVCHTPLQKCDRTPASPNHLKLMDDANTERRLIDK
ncbi:hypothetical protein, partial [Lyngbya sp. CCY1209]|uniref:hypothetical protein n=1 Tax=Lyngbya sp. CCY1209 TaxID=2886103 RepID=UPI002D210E38